jgi:hypothetical protein
MQILKVVLLAAALVGVASPSQAFLLLLGAGAEPEPPVPPTLRELPALNTEQAIRPSGLPAPFLLSPRPTMPQMQQAQVSNEELLRRLERLEQENERLRRQQGSATAQDPAPRNGLPGSRLPEQVTSGWWVHLHNWNAEGHLGAGPLRTFRYDQQRFNYTIGHRPNANLADGGEIYLYRLEAWLRVTNAGSYQIGANLNCEFNHWCDVTIALDGVRIGEFRGTNNGVRNQLVFASRQLPPGDYRLELTFNLSRNSFLKYNPALVTMEPVIRGPNDMNFRPFGPDELLVPDRRDVPIGPPLSWRSW